MNDTIARRLTELGLTLPAQPKPRHSYIPCRRAGALAFFSGKTTLTDGQVRFPGRLGELTVAEGEQAARLAALNLLAQVDCEIGLENVAAVLKLTGFVASADGFSEHAVVINAASNLLIDVLGEAGQHARTAIGVSSLPGNSPVEVEAVILAADGDAPRLSSTGPLPKGDQN